MAAATFDSRVGLSDSGRITHHISPDIDSERDKLLHDLPGTARWIEGFMPTHGCNGGGDPYRTDGNLPVVTMK